jgi:transcription elongation GreA/GreB family factor
MGDRIISSLDYQRLINQIGYDIGNNTIPMDQLHHLYLLLLGASKVKSENIKRDVITMHSNVEIQYLRSKQKKKVRIVYPGEKLSETDQEDQYINIYEPLAIAMLGLKEHDMFVTGDDTHESEPVLVEKILFQPEAHRLFKL